MPIGWYIAIVIKAIALISIPFIVLIFKKKGEDGE